MKQKLFTLFATLLCSISMFADGAKVVYTVFDQKTQALTYRYDNKYDLSNPYQEEYDPVNNPNANRFTLYNNLVKKAVIDPSMKEAPLTSMCRMFYGFSCMLSAMTTIEGLEYLNTTLVTDMNEMFYGCPALKSLDLSSFNTSNVKKMSGMFSCCEALKSIDLSSFDTSNVTNMMDMFYCCKALTSLDLSSFNTTKVTDMNRMFSLCTTITSLDLGSFNTQNVENMNQMFDRCYALESLDLSSFNTAKVTDMGCMFSDCKALTSLDLSSFNTANVTDMSNMFNGCSALTGIYCSDDWSASATLIESDKMFYGCIALVGGEGTAYNEDITDKTYACLDGDIGRRGYFTKARKVYTVFDVATQTLTYHYDNKYYLNDPYYEFYNPVNDPDAVRFTGYYNKVTKAVIDPSMKDAALTSMENLFFGGGNPETFSFYSLSKLTTIEGLENLNTFTVTDMGSMFAMCSSLTSLDLSSFNTTNVTDMNSMFFNCSALQTLDVSSFDVTKVTNMGLMFASCSKLTTIYCNRDWSTTSQALSNSYMMFSGCTKIVGGKGTTFIDDGNKDVTYARPDGGPSAPGYFTIPATLKGDADGDGEVTAADIVAMTNYIMGNTPAGFSKANADVNLDGVINIADIVAVSNILLNK